MDRFKKKIRQFVRRDQIKPKPFVSVITVVKGFWKRYNVLLESLNSQSGGFLVEKICVTPDKDFKKIKGVKIIKWEKNRTNKGAMINAGVAAASAPYVIISDADIVYHPNTLQILRILLTEQTVVGIKRFLLDSKTTNILLENYNSAKFYDYILQSLKEDKSIRGKITNKTFLGYSQILSKRKFQRTKYVEHLNTFAKSDARFRRSIVRNCNIIELPIFCLHLWHPRDWSGRHTDVVQL